jgi:hypothetical protein
LQAVRGAFILFCRYLHEWNAPMTDQTDDDKLPPQKLLHKIEQTSARLQCSIRQTYNLIDEKELEVVHIGRAVRVVVASEDAYLERLKLREAARRAAKDTAKAEQRAAKAAAKAEQQKVPTEA